MVKVVASAVGAAAIVMAGFVPAAVEVLGIRWG
jgi:hypothetical protein